ncbi:MAG: hypothetical protein HY292_26520 [Planctomycetes bacterium]|nr:hypothetical protein [Planctomycetota bacterium]
MDRSGLEGPASLATLQRLAANAKTVRRLAAIRRTDLWEADLAGISVVVARTGYTGEDFGYELFVHPDRATAFWEAILAAGADLGVKPCGLGARDSTRTEAGLPLHGHELAGPHAISPAAAGFGPYVKLHKPFFVGRGAFVAQEKSRTMEVLRFRITEKGVAWRRPATSSRTRAASSSDTSPRARWTSTVFRSAWRTPTAERTSRARRWSSFRHRARPQRSPSDSGSSRGARWSFPRTR